MLQRGKQTNDQMMSNSNSESAKCLLYKNDLNQLELQS